MLIEDKFGNSLQVPDNDRLQQAISAGAVRIESVLWMKATIITPPGFQDFTDDEILLTLRFAGEVGRMLEDIGFKVVY